MNFRNYEINGRFVTNLEPKFKIEHGRVKEYNKRCALGISFMENGSNLSAQCVCQWLFVPTCKVKKKNSVAPSLIYYWTLH